MKILRADHLGMCFGVRDAIALAKENSRSGPLTVLGDLVHNQSVLNDLSQHGVQFEKDERRVRTPRVMITAHGASEARMRNVRARGLDVVEATCPLVHHAHQAVNKLVAEGYRPVIIGKRDHVEVRGMTEDLVAYDVVLTEADIDQLPARPRFGVAAQTTQPIERVRALVAYLEQRFPDSEVRFVDTVCRPTKQRQAAAVELATKASVVVVIGGANSNNTHELVRTCSKSCDRVHHVQSAGELQLDWFHDDDIVGITAGTSTPDYLIDGVENWLRNLANGDHRQAA